MIKNKARILCTRPLDASLIEQAGRQGIVIESLSFITTQSIVDEKLGIQIGHLSAEPIVAVFTSMNAVEAVARYLVTAPRWRIFSIGLATERSVRENFREGCIAGTADSARALAGEILARVDIMNIREVVFFCGDQRRDELPEQLKQAGVRVNELIVYKTAQTPHNAEEAYDAVVFFSPSAVHSFFSNNTLPAGAILFAIGHTTAEAIRAYSGNKVIVSESPDKEALIGQAIDYFQTKNIRY